jgi:GntR family transcriptional regulator
MIDWSRRPGVPRHVQVADIITAGIASGEYPAGFLLSERAIMEEFGIARGTARKVFAVLRERELVFTVKNMGSFVGRPEAEDDAR